MGGRGREIAARIINTKSTRQVYQHKKKKTELTPEHSSRTIRGQQAAMELELLP